MESTDYNSLLSNIPFFQYSILFSFIFFHWREIRSFIEWHGLIAKIFYRFHHSFYGKHLCSFFSIGFNGDCLSESSNALGVIMHLDGCHLSFHDRLFGPCRNSASAASACIGDNERLLAGILKAEFTASISTLLNGAVIMQLLGKRNLRSIRIIFYFF